MKTTNIFLILFLTVLLSFGFAMTSFATVVGSPHDLTTRPDTARQNGEICIYCHTPHHAKDEPADYSPLWNAGVQTSETFTPYSSSTLDADIGDPLVGPSRLCISCHDGTIAVDIALNDASTRRIAGAREIGVGGTLASDHPIGFDYVAVAATDDEIKPASTEFSTGTISDFLFTSGSEQMMTCATCHDVHEWGSGHMFLHVDNAGSALCFNCHIK